MNYAHAMVAHEDPTFRISQNFRARLARVAQEEVLSRLRHRLHQALLLAYNAEGASFEIYDDG